MLLRLRGFLFEIVLIAFKNCTFIVGFRPCWIPEKTGDLQKYIGAFEPDEPGAYKLVATCRETGASVIADLTVQGTLRERRSAVARYDVLREVAENYDIDGLDLDYTRIPPYFNQGEEEQGRQAMNQHVRDVRGLALDDLLHPIQQLLLLPEFRHSKE